VSDGSGTSTHPCTVVGPFVAPTRMIALPMLNDAGTRHPLGDHPAVRAIGGLADPHERFAPKTVRELTIALATIHNSNSRLIAVSDYDRIRPGANLPQLANKTSLSPLEK